MTNKILVTGASGFVGKHTLAPLIERGYEVYAVSRKPGPEIVGVTWVTADLLDQAQRRALIARIKPSHMLHAAWYAEHSKFWHAAENIDWLAASLDLVRCFIACGGKRIVGIGSCAEYDWQSAQGGTFAENAPCQPATIYGKTKLSLMTMMEALAKQSNISYAWARLFFMFGPDEPPAKLVASVIASLKQDKAALCSSGNQLRDFSHVADIGKALAGVMASQVTGPINVASGRAVTIAHVAKMIGEITGKAALVQLGALPDRPGEAEIIVADTHKLQQEALYVFPPLRQRLCEVIGDV